MRWCTCPPKFATAPSSQPQLQSFCRERQHSTSPDGSLPKLRSFVRFSIAQQKQKPCYRSVPWRRVGVTVIHVSYRKLRPHGGGGVGCEGGKCAHSCLRYVFGPAPPQQPRTEEAAQRSALTPGRSWRPHAHPIGRALPRRSRGLPGICLRARARVCVEGVGYADRALSHGRHAPLFNDRPTCGPLAEVRHRPVRGNLGSVHLDFAGPQYFGVGGGLCRGAEAGKKGGGGRHSRASTQPQQWIP